MEASYSSGSSMPLLAGRSAFAARRRLRRPGELGRIHQAAQQHGPESEDLPASASSFLRDLLLRDGPPPTSIVIVNMVAESSSDRTLACSDLRGAPAAGRVRPLRTTSTYGTGLTTARISVCTCGSTVGLRCRRSPRPRRTSLPCPARRSPRRASPGSASCPRSSCSRSRSRRRPSCRPPSPCRTGASSRPRTGQSMNLARSPFSNIAADRPRDVLVVERQRDLLAVLVLRHPLERLAADEVVVELDDAAVADVPRREVVVLDVCRSTKLPPIEPCRRSPWPAAIRGTPSALSPV